MKKFRIVSDGWKSLPLRANCLKDALMKYVEYNPNRLTKWKVHFYTKSKKLSWAEFETDYGYCGRIEEVGEEETWVI